MDMRFQRAFLQQNHKCQLAHEEALVAEECARREIPCILFPAKKAIRRQLPLGPQDFVMGTLDVMEACMKQLGIPPPAVGDYPEALRPHLHRTLWRSTVGGVQRRLEEGDGQSFFVKPADKQKRFTGFVISFPEDFQRLAHLSRKDHVWCSEEVTWLNEYRLYVVNGKIASADCYDGDPSLELCMEMIQTALSAFLQSGEAPDAFTLDFGILNTGETALIEFNDALSVGAYKIGATAYTEFLFARWRQLLQSADPTKFAPAPSNHEEDQQQRH